MKIIFLFFVVFTSLTFSDKIKLQLQWKHQFEFAGFYAAKERGFYKDAGLDVEFVEYRDKTNIIEVNHDPHLTIMPSLHF